MFAFPVACLVFAMVGLALGVHSRKEGKFGGFTLGLAVLFAYYGVMVYFEGRTKGGQFPAEWARWMPNIILGIVSLVAIRWRMRAVGGGVTIRLPAFLTKLFRRSRSSEAASKASPRFVVVIRIPDIQLPRPRLLDLYVSRRYLGVVTLSFAGLLGLYYIGTVIDKSERLFKGTADGWMLASFLYYSTPQFLAYVIPMAILFAVLATIGAMTRNGELVVMRSCGVSLYRAALPLLVLALIWSGGLFLLDDRVLARANRRAEELDRRIKGATTSGVEMTTSGNWLVDTRGRIYHFSLFEPARGVLHGVSVFEPAPRAVDLVTHMWASRVTFSEGAWHAERGWVQRFSSNNRAVQEPFKSRRLDLDPPDRFPALQNQDTGMMTFRELRHHINERATQGQAVVEPSLKFQERLAFPMVAVVMTVLGVPFGATTGRRGSLYGIGLALIIGVSYWLLNTFFLAVGQAALMPAALAAWAANLLLLAVAAYLTLTVRT
jgi:LPS export ABC transporter permease LptG